MIEINLLPESMRKAQGTPLPRFIVTCVGLVLVLSLGFLVAILQFRVIPAKVKERDEKTREVEQAETTAAELDTLTAKIEAIQNRVNNVKSLFLGRKIWAKILWDLKRIITLDETMNEANPELRYLWINSMTYNSSKDRIDISGNATSTSSTKSMRIVENLIKNMRTYSALEKPEKAAKKRLEEEIKAKKMEWEKRRQDDDSLAPESDEIKKLKARLNTLKNVESGMVAMTPFFKLFKPDGIKLIRTVWGASAGAPKKKDAGNFLPRTGHKFKISLQFKPTEEEE